MSSSSETSEQFLAGVLHVYAAFDWAEDVDLATAGQRIPSEWHALPRKSRTPSSFSYQPRPLRVKLKLPPLEVPGLPLPHQEADATLFDFGAVSIAMHFPFRLSLPELLRLAGWCADPTVFVEAARRAAAPVYEALLPEMQNPRWSDLGEDYIVFQLVPDPRTAVVHDILTLHASWLAGLVRLEREPLSSDEVVEALRVRQSYGPDDLLVVDWAAAVLIDRDCEETLEAIAFANLQLLEFREIDRRLDAHLARAYGLIRRLTGSSLPFWRSHSRPLRNLAILKVEANEMLDRTTNVLKLIGDPYLARIYRLLVSRFHLEQWGAGIQRSLDVLQSIHQVVSDQAGTFRAESLEVIVVILIFVEIVLAFFRH